MPGSSSPWRDAAAGAPVGARWSSWRPVRRRVAGDPSAPVSRNSKVLARDAAGGTAARLVDSLHLARCHGCLGSTGRPEPARTRSGSHASSSPLAASGSGPSGSQSHALMRRQCRDVAADGHRRQTVRAGDASRLRRPAATHGKSTSSRVHRRRARVAEALVRVIPRRAARSRMSRTAPSPSAASASWYAGLSWAARAASTDSNSITTRQRPHAGFVELLRELTGRGTDRRPPRGRAGRGRRTPSSGSRR